MDYRKKSIVQAFQWFNGMSKIYVPLWFDNLVSAIVEIKGGGATIKTWDGNILNIDNGDYVIMVEGSQLYTCKPDVFESAYEPV